MCQQKNEILRISVFFWKDFSKNIVGVIDIFK